MAKTNVTSTQFAAKKLLGKTQTRPSLTDAQEAYPSNVSVPGGGVFAESIPREPGTEYFTLFSASAGLPATVERVYFDLVAVGDGYYDGDASAEDGGESGQNATNHAYYLKLPANYETTSSNPNKGSGNYVNGKRVYLSKGGLQLIPPFATDAGLPGASGNNRYYVEIFTGDPSDPANKISSTDAIDWQFDYYSGILFIQDSASAAPVTASAYLYTGKYLDEKLTDISAAAGNNITVKDEGSNITTAASSLNFVGATVVASNSGNDVTVTINEGIDYGRTTITTTSTASVSSRILGVNASDAIDIRLPSAANYSAGQYFVIKDESGTAHTNNITILASGSQTLDGNTSIILESPYAAVNIYSNGTDKFFIY
jgi:hypothetical protein